MNYQEEIRDLFTVSEEYALVHCISSDFALGAGIAKEINARFDVKRELFDKYPDYINTFAKYSEMHSFGDCLVTDRKRLVLNMVTKKWCWNKPTAKCFYESLLVLRRVVEKNHIKKIAMPLIGCGLDQLKWEWVSTKIKQVFADVDIDILVCKI